MNNYILSKRDGDYYLFKDDSWALGSSSDRQRSPSGYKLSVDNCNAISNGYDLDELAIKTHGKDYEMFQGQINWFNKGFQKAIELLGDKEFKFTKKELVNLLIDFVGFPHPYSEPRGSISERFVQTIRQNEWNVEIEMTENCPFDYTSRCTKGRCDCSKPKLDSNGCIILNRI